jgi:transcriptional regulator with XRE-family HTH domain
MGAALRMQRRFAGLSQRTAAAQAGMSFSHLANLEADRRNPSKAHLDALTSVFAQAQR